MGTKTKTRKVNRNKKNITVSELSLSDVLWPLREINKRDSDLYGTWAEVVAQVNSWIQDQKIREDLVGVPTTTILKDYVDWKCNSILTLYITRKETDTEYRRRIEKEEKACKKEKEKAKKQKDAKKRKDVELLKSIIKRYDKDSLMVERAKDFLAAIEAQNKCSISVED